MTRVGILGGGQLCLMLAESLHQLGAEVNVYDPDPSAPARKRLPQVTTASWSDERALRRFFRSCDVVTYEFENVPASALSHCPDETRVVPGVAVLETTQDRIREKEFLATNGLPHVDFAVARDEAALARVAAEFGYPFILKRAQGGYDGKGQGLIRSARELERSSVETGAGPTGWVLEDVIEIETELSCIVARAEDGAECVYPVLENTHRDHILDYTLLPARVPPAIGREAQRLALVAARALRARGVLTVEFFLGRSRRRPTATRLFVNEIAPRPHNSGHVTRRACTSSQFDALARVLVGAPLAEPRLAGPGVYCMGNLLGDVWAAQGEDTHLDLSAWGHHPDVLEVYLYGKGTPHERRKMGHFIAHGESADAALRVAQEFRHDLRVGGPVDRRRMGGERT